MAWCAGCAERWIRAHRIVPPMMIFDGCCGAGGATRGYASAGHEVWGVDSNPRLREDYLRSGAAEFICADVLEVMADTSFMGKFDFSHYSPPCQSKSAMSACRPGLAATYPELITPGRPLLQATGKPYVIENVSRMRPLMIDPVTMCMAMFGRETYRHRLLEAGGGLTLTAPVPPISPGRPAHACNDSQNARGEPARGLKLNRECGWPHPVATARAGHWVPGKYVSVAGHERKEPVQHVMEVPWMRNRDDVKESIPPYLTAWIAEQLDLIA